MFPSGYALCNYTAARAQDVNKYLMLTGIQLAEEVHSVPGFLLALL